MRYDPYFSLSIARVDPLPHQLEAVYDYFLKIPHIRFLLYAVYNCASTPEVHPIQDPARLRWEPIVKIEHYHIGAEVVL